MNRVPSWMVAGAAIAILSASSAASAGAIQQQPGRNIPFEFKIGGHAGATLFTEFLEQSVGDRERELNAQMAPTFGASISVGRGPLTEARLSLDWTGTDIEFEDDTGDDGDELDDDGLADLNLALAQLAVVRYFLTPDYPVAPFATLGVNLAFWMLDEEPGGAVGADDETQIRYGATAGVGARFKVDPRFHIKLEIDRVVIGNPFDGNNAFRVGGDSFDEPAVVGTTRYIAGLFYTL